MENMTDEIMALYKAHQKEFEERHKHMPLLKYKRGDVVTFRFVENEQLEGMIEIVDRYGTFEQNDEPSYDIYRFSDNTLYKHVRESQVVSFIRSGDPAEAYEHSKKYLNWDKDKPEQM